MPTPSKRWALAAFAGVLAATVLRGVASPAVVSIAPQTKSAETPTPSPEQIRRLLDELEFKQAEEAARRALAEVETRGEEQSLAAANLLDLLVEALWQQGDAIGPETETLAERAIAMKEGALDPDRLEIVVSLTNLGIVRELTGRYDEARALYERALRIQQIHLGPNHPDVAFSLTNLGILTRTTGDYSAAAAAFERALAIREQAFGPTDVRVAYTAHNLATVQVDTGDYVGARVSFERAVEIFERELGPDSTRLADGIEGLGVLLRETGDPAAARPLFGRALAIRERALGPGDSRVAWALINVGALHLESGQPGQARAALERALTIDEQSLGPEHRDVGFVLHHLAQAVSGTDGYDAAQPLYHRAIRVWEATLGPDHPHVSWTLTAQASQLVELGRHSAAQPLLERALRIRERSLGLDSDKVAEVLNLLAIVLAELGHPNDALRTALRAEEIGREHHRLMARGLPERQALQYRAAQALRLDVAASLLVRQPEALLGWTREVWDGVIRSRALVLDEMAARRRVVGTAEEIARLGLALGEARERLANLVVRGPGDDLAAFRRTAELTRRRKERLEAELAERSALFREEQSRSLLGFDDVARALPPRTALVAYLRSRTGLGSSYAAFVLPRRTAGHLVPLGEAGRIDALVERWRAHVEEGSLGRGLRRSELAAARAGAELRRRIWDPLAPFLGTPERVLVVPDGSLHLLSLAALPTPEGPYVIETGPVVHYVSAERDLAPARAERRGRGLLVLGDPSFDGPVASPAGPPTSLAVAGPGIRLRGQAGECASFRDLEFEALPASGEEADQIAGVWRAVQQAADGDSAAVLALRGEAASEAILKREAPGRRVIHLATHGFFLGDDCPGGVERSSPLLLSGLALSGANRRGAAGAGGEDGILTAEEIAALDLSSVEWAVLSACNTGLGMVRAGEGVLGLRRAFQVAGAGSVVMSLWSVEDRTARRFMTYLYRKRFEAGLPTAAALHEAALGILHERRQRGEGGHPFFWAPFVAAGAWQ